MEFIDTAPREGAELVEGGKRVLPESGGYFIEPTLFRNVAPGSRLAQEEVFGPVLAATAFQDVDEAIGIANSTMYGLGAYVWTTDLSTAMRTAKAIRSDVVVGTGSYKGEGAGFAASWEPVGQSGIGTESGLAGMESYLRRQLIAFQHA
jgi:acyl-CoA reductase-like NAD-dependent aldehyde dehydrogenase